MSMRVGRLGRDDRGVGIIELLVGLAIFALFFLLIDAVFIGTHRSSRKAELAADVQQNARIAVERLTREIRESRCAPAPSTCEVVISPSFDKVMFKSARLDLSQETFCVFVRSTTEALYSPSCFYGSLTPPPYASLPPAGCPPPTVVSGGVPACAYGTYTPIWQRSIGYWLDGTTLRRQTNNLTAPGDVLNLATLTSGEIIASFVNTFEVHITTANGNFTVALDAKGTKIVQGSQVPQQEVQLNGTTLTRN